MGALPTSAPVLDVQLANAVQQLALALGDGNRGRIAGVHRPVPRRDREDGADVHERQEGNGDKHHHKVERNLSASRLHLPWSFK